METVGPISDLTKRALGFKQGHLFQTVHQLEDSFDWEGMEEGKTSREKYSEKSLSICRINTPLQKFCH